MTQLELDLTQNTMKLAKQIRQEGEEWSSAIERALELKKGANPSAESKKENPKSLGCAL